MKTTYTSAKLAKIYMSRIVCLHGVPTTIVSDRGTQFTSKFLHQLHQTLGTRLEFSTAFHPQTDGQIERVNQIREDMLRACALDYGSSWDDNLPYVDDNQLLSQFEDGAVRSPVWTEVQNTGDVG